MSHDMPGWGAQAEAVGWDAGARRLRLSEPMAFGAGGHYVGLRRPDGSLSGPWAVSPGADPAEVVPADLPDFTPESGSRRERTHVVFGTAAAWRVLARVAAIRPRSEHQVEIEAVIEDPAVHAADTGAAPPPIVLGSLPGRVTVPEVRGLMARKMPADTRRILLAWRAAPGAEIYHVEMAEGTDPAGPAVSWTRIVDTSSSSCAVPILYPARTMIRVRGAGLVAGPWVAATIGTLIPDMWNTGDTPMWTSDTDLMWSL